MDTELSSICKFWAKKDMGFLKKIGSCCTCYVWENWMNWNADNCKSLLDLALAGVWSSCEPPVPANIGWSFSPTKSINFSLVAIKKLRIHIWRQDYEIILQEIYNNIIKKKREENGDSEGFKCSTVLTLYKRWRLHPTPQVGLAPPANLHK